VWPPNDLVVLQVHPLSTREEIGQAEDALLVGVEATVHGVLPAKLVECGLGLRRGRNADHLDQLHDAEAARNVRFLVSDARVGWDQAGQTEQHAARERIVPNVEGAVMNHLKQRGRIPRIDRGHVLKNTTFVVFPQWARSLLMGAHDHPM
jgi:hypothetical protein